MGDRGTSIRHPSRKREGGAGRTGNGHATSHLEATRQPRDLLQGVQRACRILSMLADERRPLSPREIAVRLGINLSTCYHLLNTLEHNGFLSRDESRLVRFGPAIRRLHDGFEAMLDPDPLLVRWLTVLNQRTGESSALGVWRQGEVVSIAIREGTRDVHVRGFQLGYNRHSYARALGRALLAYRDREFIDEYLNKTSLERLTPKTIISAKELKRRLAAVRRTGVAVEREELMSGVCCVGSAVFGPDGDPVAAYSVSVPKARFDIDSAEIIEAVKDAAASASRELKGLPVDGS